MGVWSIAALISSVETVRRHAILSDADVQLTCEVMKSKVGCTFVMSPDGNAEPDSIHAARKRPPVLPPFAIMCAATEMLPALSPQLLGGDGRRERMTGGRTAATHIVTLAGSPPKAAMWL